MKIFNNRQLMIIYSTHLLRSWLADELIRFLENSSHADWFEAKLFDLICKADFSNRQKIMKGFPHHIFIYNQYIKKGERWMRKAYRVTR